MRSFSAIRTLSAPRPSFLLVTTHKPAYTGRRSTVPWVRICVQSLSLSSCAPILPYLCTRKLSVSPTRNYFCLHSEADFPTAFLLACFLFQSVAPISLPALALYPPTPPILEVGSSSLPPPTCTNPLPPYAALSHAFDHSHIGRIPNPIPPCDHIPFDSASHYELVGRARRQLASRSKHVPTNRDIRIGQSRGDQVAKSIAG